MTNKNTEASYTSLINLPMITKTAPTDRQTTYAMLLSMELSPEELLGNIGMETSFGGTSKLLCNVLRHTTKTYQKNLKWQRSWRIDSLKKELNQLKVGSNNSNATS